MAQRHQITDYRLPITDRVSRRVSLRLQSKPDDGEQVEPAPVEPDNVQVREARQTDGELARE